MRKAAAYARVSTLHQSDLSLVGQFEECDRYAESNEIEIVAYFADKETGKVNRREQLDELINQAKRREFEYILVDDFDSTRPGKEHINFICEFFADRKIVNRKGKPWSKTAIWDILHNEKYIGSIVYGKGSDITK